MIFFVNLILEFNQYKKLIQNEIYYAQGTIINHYQKKNYAILKIKTENFTFFTKDPTTNQNILFHNIDLYIVSKNITFISYLKGFYSNSFNSTIYSSKSSKKKIIYDNILNQHKSDDLSSLYSALFIASPLNQKIRELSNKLGISHLIAISGFHLGVISLVLYFLIHLLYNKIHSTYFPYRNKKSDIMICVSVILFSYMIFIDNPPSLLRAFFMFIFAFFLLRNNIKIISFETLFIVLVSIIALFPKLLFSLSLWFSIIGVFYIYLFLKYFKNINKFIQLIIFNFWIYFTINPITHYFFPTTALEQIYSPILTIIFSIFYPLSVFLHLFNIGNFFDLYLTQLMDINIYTVEVNTPQFFFIMYCFVSLLSIGRKEIFILLNILMILYNIWLFHFIF